MRTRVSNCDTPVIFAPVRGLLGCAIECCQLHFSPTDSHCHGMVTQMIFAVLENWYHHIVFTHSCKLVSFLHIYLLFYCQKSGNEPDACKNRYQDPYFYLLPFWSRAVYLRSGTERWMCLLLLLLLLRCCSLYLEIKVGCSRLRLTSSNCQTLNPHLRQMQGSWWYLLYKPRYPILS